MKVINWYRPAMYWYSEAERPFSGRQFYSSIEEFFENHPEVKVSQWEVMEAPENREDWTKKKHLGKGE